MPEGVPSGVWGHPVQGRILRIVRDAAGGVTRQDVHRLLPDVPLRTRNHTLKRLVEKGWLCEQVDPARGVRLVAALHSRAGSGGASLP